MKEYKQIFNGKYDDKGAVQAIDILNDKPLTKDYFKTRPDMKQRIEKAINTGTYLASYQRGTRLGYTFIAEEDVKQAMVTAVKASISTPVFPLLLTEEVILKADNFFASHPLCHLFSKEEAISLLLKKIR